MSVATTEDEAGCGLGIRRLLFVWPSTSGREMTMAVNTSLITRQHRYFLLPVRSLANYDQGFCHRSFL